MCGKCCTRIVGLLLVFVGFHLTGFWNVIYTEVLVSKLSLSNNSDTFVLWNRPPFPIYLKFYLFNWTNPGAAFHEEKAHFEQKGPYVFRENRTREIKEWNSNSTVTFETLYKWEFVPEMSNGSLQDNITTLNVVAVSICNLLKNASALEKIAVSELLQYNHISLDITKTVNELLFEGYDDKILDLLEKVKRIFNITVPFDRFGWWYGKNMTTDGLFNMHTGRDDINKLGELYTWNYKNHTSAYNGTCGLVHGTNGELWPRDAPSRNNISIFIPSMCGSVTLSRNGEKSVSGLEGSYFEGEEDVFDNGTIFPDSSCYCPHDKCSMPSGIRNVSPCLNGTPAYVSFPHFYLADQSYVNAISGLYPNRSSHAFHITLQKDTGVNIEVKARLQINIMLEPIQHIKLLENVPKVLIPAVWFEQYMILPPSFFDRMKVLVYLPYVFTIGGFILVLLGSLILFFSMCRYRFSLFRSSVDSSNSYRPLD